MGSNLPSPEEMLQRWLALTPAPECHIDGDSPLGTDNCVLVVQDAPDRILMTHEAESETGEAAKTFLPGLTALGLNVDTACSAYSHIRQLVHIFDYAHSKAQAKRRLTQLRKDIQAVADDHLDKILNSFDDH